MGRTSLVGRTMTLEDFLRLPEQKPVLEYIDGRIEAKVSPQFKHSVLTLRVADHLNRFAEPTGLGLAVPELRCTFAGRSIVPDVVFLLDRHIAVDDRGEFVNEVFLPPDLHVEIVSPDQSVKKCRDKLAHSTSNGCPLGWLIDPERKAVDVYGAGQPPERLSPDGSLEGGAILPGYRLPVAEVFGWLVHRRPEAKAGGADAG